MIVKRIRIVWDKKEININEKYTNIYYFLYIEKVYKDGNIDKKQSTDYRTYQKQNRHTDKVRNKVDAHLLISYLL